MKMEATPVSIDLSPEHGGWTAVLRTNQDGEQSTDLHDDTNTLRVSVPFRCDRFILIAIVRAFRVGHAHGSIDGGNRVRNDMLKVLGL